MFTGESDEKLFTFESPIVEVGCSVGATITQGSAAVIREELYVNKITANQMLISLDDVHNKTFPTELL